MEYIYQVKFYEDWDKGRELIDELFFTSFEKVEDYLSSLGYVLKHHRKRMGEWYFTKSYGEFAIVNERYVKE